MRPFRKRTTTDTMTCRDVGRVVQAFLDIELDDLTARRVSAHLALCRRCGLDLEVYADIKSALTRRAGHGDDEFALRRLRSFAQDLAEHGEPSVARHEEPGNPA